MSDPFKVYERTKVETKKVAKVTEENIHLIAAACKGQVDYSGEWPELVVLSKDAKPWRVKIGWDVQILGTRLINGNGFNSDGDWKEIES